MIERMAEMPVAIATQPVIADEKLFVVIGLFNVPVGNDWNPK